MQFFYVFFATMMYVLHKTYTIKIHKIPTEQYPCSKNVGIRLRMHKLNACKYELPKTNFFYGAQFGRTNKRFYMIFLWLLLHQVNIIKIMQFSNRQICGRGPSLYYVRTQGWVGGTENGNFLLLYVLKMSLLRRGWVLQEKPKHPYVI